MKRKGLAIGICLVLLVAFSAVKVEAQGYCNPLFLPFAVAGAVIGTAAALTTALVPAPFYPAYYGPAYYGPGPGCWRSGCWRPGPLPPPRRWVSRPPYGAGYSGPRPYR